MTTRSLSSRLTSRLLMIAVLISALLSAGVFMNVRDAFGSVAGDRAVLNAARFNAQYLHLLDGNLTANRQALQRALEEYGKATARVHSTIGRFVSVRLYDSHHVLLARREDADHERIALVNGVLDADIGLDDPRPGQIQQSIRIDGVPYVRVYLPLLDSRGREVLFADAVFAISPESLKYLRDRTLNMMIAVFMIVMTTTLILSPALFSLVDEEERTRSEQA